MSSPRVVCLGEGMIEERIAADGRLTSSFGGDTLNTAIHLARKRIDVRYASAIGASLADVDLRRAWERNGIDCSLLLTHPTRSAGRYRITLDRSGERSFSYERSESAAREMLRLADNSWREAVSRADLLFFSLISLAILAPDDRAQLVDMAGAVSRHGGKVAFDGNYRPLLWESADAARNWRDKAISVADFGLPTFEDEQLLDSLTDVDGIAGHWSRLGCKEVVVKLGAAGCRLPGGQICAPRVELSPVDTSGAGDAFDAGYLAARLNGSPPHEAAIDGHDLAGLTIMHPGAIPDLV